MVPPVRCSFDELQRDSHWGHPFHSPSRSQPQVEPEHSCPPSCSAESRKLMQGEALNRSAWRSFFGILQVPFFKPKLCKSPTTPFVTPPPPVSLVPQPPQQVPTQALWAAHPSVLPPSTKKNRLLSHNSLMARSVLSSLKTPQGVCVRCTTHSHTISVLGFCRLWTYGPRVQEVEAKINPKQQSIYRRRAHPWFDPPVALSFL